MHAITDASGKGIKDASGVKAEPPPGVQRI